MQCALVMKRSRGIWVEMKRFPHENRHDMEGLSAFILLRLCHRGYQPIMADELAALVGLLSRLTLRDLWLGLHPFLNLVWGRQPRG